MIRITFLLFCVLAIACKPTSPPPDGFQIEAGFYLERVASEPLIKDPVDLEFNERGDALVLEMPGYPFEDQQSRIVVLKDDNEDGIYDRSQLFIENLQLASSFIPYKKGLLVAAPPYLLYVRDENQDYTPEGVDTLMGGFSTGNLQHNYNGLVYGLDHWIYAANGGNDGAPYWWGDKTSQLDLRGQDFRFNPELKKIERLGESSGGFGLAMDEFGRWFETHNLTHISHLVFPDRYIREMALLKEHSLENISDHEENGLARIYPIGEQETRVNHPEQSGYFSGSCGITYYGGGAFGEEYEHTVWVADVVLNLIHVDKMEPNASSFKASRLLQDRDFLASTDRSFRPVNMAVGPNGALYVVDMYRKVIEHPEWIPDEIEKTLDLAAGKDQGRIYRISKNPRSKPFDMAKFDSQTGLVNSLSDPNQWVRMTAHRLLAEQAMTAETVGLLRQELKSDNYLSRFHSMWTLHAAGKLNDSDLLESLKAPSADIRECALQIAEARISENEQLLAACAKALGDPNARIRMQAALSLSTLPELNRDAWWPVLLDEIQKFYVPQGDSWTTAALSLAAGTRSAELLCRMLEDPGITASDELLQALTLTSPKTLSAIKAVLVSLSEANIPNSSKQNIIAHLSVDPGAISGESLESAIAQLENSGDNSLIADLASLRKKLNLSASAAYQKLSRQALIRVLDNSLPDSIRLRQLRLIEQLAYAEKSDVLFACLNFSEPTPIQENALRQLSWYNEKEIGEKLVHGWREMSPHIRRYAGDLLLYREIHNPALLTGLENGSINIGEMNFDLERRRQLLWWTDDINTKRRAEKLFGDAGVYNRQEAIDQMMPALDLQGSGDNGALIFEKLCASCHQYGKLGTDLGPVLTEISRKSKETLLHDILDPNAAVDPIYINHRLELTNGEVHLGIISAETDEFISIKKLGGETIRAGKKQIKSFRSLGTSLMMEGLEKGMTQKEMADLLEFLQRGKS